MEGCIMWFRPVRTNSEGNAESSLVVYRNVAVDMGRLMAASGSRRVDSEDDAAKRKRASLMVNPLGNQMRVALSKRNLLPSGTVRTMILSVWTSETPVFLREAADILGLDFVVEESLLEVLLDGWFS